METRSIEREVVAGVRLARSGPRAVAGELRALLAAGAVLAPAGEARARPGRLLERYPPRDAVELFGTRLYLAGPFVDEDIGFLLAYLAPPRPRGGRARRVWPRVFYKDLSLVWRVGTHLVRTADDHWIGKGDVRVERRGGYEHVSSAEETTNLPFELQGALDDARGRARPRNGGDVTRLVLRRAPVTRIRAYADFTAPRRRAARRYRVNGGRRVARFTRRGDPRSLQFAPGFEPDFRRGVVETTASRSRLYGGRVDKFRILSRNREIQYQFAASPTHVWLNPPQALTTELSTYGVRTVDVAADEELFVPGYEYHYEDGGCFHSQIPEGFAGAPSPIDDHRADASPWIEELPVVRSFRRAVLGERGR